MRVYYTFTNSAELIPAEDLLLPLDVETGDIYSCYGLLYQVVEELHEKDKTIYKLKFV